MKKAEIKVGGLYIAKVSGKLTTVRVDEIREIEGYSTGEIYYKTTHPSQTRYDVTNMKTGRKTLFRSAAKFRGIARVESLYPPEATKKMPDGTTGPESVSSLFSL